MRIEGDWDVEFRSATGQGDVLAVFEPERMFGGARGWFYSGEYQLNGGKITAHLRVPHYGETTAMASGQASGQPFELDLDGEFASDDHIEATAAVAGEPEQMLKLAFRRWPAP